MNPKKGDIVKCVFDDHCEDGSDLIRFIVYGRLSEKTKVKLVIDSWEYVDEKTPHDENEKRFTIARSAVRELVKMVEC